MNGYDKNRDVKDDDFLYEDKVVYLKVHNKENETWWGKDKNVTV